MNNLFGSEISVRRFLCTACFFLTVSAYALPAQAQNNDARLKRIENEIETLSRAVFRGEAPPPGSLAVGDNASAANTEVRLQQIEMDLRELTGKVEERNYEAQQFQTRTEQAIAALEMRIAELEMRLGSAAIAPQTAPSIPPSYGTGGVSSGLGMDMEPHSSIEAAPVSPQAMPADETEMGQLGTIPAQPGVAGDETFPPAPAMAVDDPVGLYEQAFSYLRDRNYDQAQTVFQDFLTRYPQHDLAPNAKYWLGESYYVRNDFEKAARIFAEAYQQYPKGAKGPDNLLKLGMSLAGLGKNEDACLTYGQLQKEYPNGAMPVMMRAEQEMEKLGCQQF